MDWVQLHCDRLRSKLQDVVNGGANANAAPRVPWSWVCRSIIETVTRYPSGLTEAVIMAELELLWRRDVRGAFVPGKLQAYLDAQYAPLSDVVQACVVRHADQLVTLVEDHSLSVSCDLPPTTCVVDMYLHQNFKSCLRYTQGAGHDLLAPGRKVRLTGCRLLTGTTAALTGSGRAGAGGGGGEAGRRSSPSTLLLTEYLAFVLDHRRSRDLRLAAGAFALGRTRVRDTFNESSNHEAFFVVCKVLEIRRPRQHSASGGAYQQSRKRRQTLQTVVLECAARTTAGRPNQQPQQRRPGGPTEENTINSSGSVGLGTEDGGVCDSSSSSSRETVLLYLWDEQTCLASLFRKGDGLVVYWPWLVQEQEQEQQQPHGGEVVLDSAAETGGRAASQQQQKQQLSLSSQVPLPGSASGWHFEYGSATALFVLPRESRAQLFAAANGVANRNGGGEGAAGACPMETKARGGGGGGGFASRGKLSRGVGAAAGARGGSVRGSGGGVLRAQDMPADENGVRDLLQFPSRLSVSDLAPNLSNVSVYGQVLSVACVAGSFLPAVLPPSRATASANQASSSTSSSSSPFLSQLPLKPVMLLQQQQQQQQQRQQQRQRQQRQRQPSGTKVVELWVRDERGKARVFCCGRRAAADALRCRPGQYVLACGLRTFAAAFPPLDAPERPGGDVVVVCGEAGEASRGEEEGAATAAAAPGRAAGARGGGGGHGGVGGVDGLGGRILNTSCLEGLLHCPFLSRHSLLHDKQRAPGPRATFACKAAVTWARWAFDGDGLWAVHRRCGSRLPCHYTTLCRASADTAAGKTSRKRPREVRDPGSVGGRASGARQDDASAVTCPLCKSDVRLDGDDEAELAFAPLLLALDDGTRCLVAECGSEVVTVALGGTNPHVYLQMGRAERDATLASLVGREIRCVVGGNGGGDGSGGGGGGGGGGDHDVDERVEFRVERMASTNPAADLAHVLSLL